MRANRRSLEHNAVVKFCLFLTQQSRTTLKAPKARRWCSIHLTSNGARSSTNSKAVVDQNIMSAPASAPVAAAPSQLKQEPVPASAQSMQAQQAPGAGSASAATTAIAAAAGSGPAPPADAAGAERKEIYTYDGTLALPAGNWDVLMLHQSSYVAPWLVYAMNWSVRPDQKFRLAIGSYVEEYHNKVLANWEPSKMRQSLAITWYFSAG